jgi:hypothetical protein
MFQTAPPPIELSLAVVGLQYDNDNGSSRTLEARLCAPGAPVRLVREPKNRKDPRAVAVFSARGVQLGYVSAERCGWVGRKIEAGEHVEAIFQELGERIFVMRVRFGGGEPSLPRFLDREPIGAAIDHFYADPPAPDWGA